MYSQFMMHGQKNIKLNNIHTYPTFIVSIFRHLTTFSKRTETH